MQWHLSLQHTSPHLGLIHSLDVGSREVGVDFIDVLLVHVLGNRVLVQIVHHIGAGEDSVDLQKPMPLTFFFTMDTLCVFVVHARQLIHAQSN